MAAEGAMVMLLDDPSPLVRRALAEVLADREEAPPALILSLANEQAEIAAPVLQRSPLLLDADLVEIVGAGEPAAQLAIARRAHLPCAVAAALAEVGTAEACLILIENPTAEIAPFSLDRIVGRCGHLAAVREAVFARPDVPLQTRQALVLQLAETLANFVSEREWLGRARAQQVAREACEKATVTLAAVSSHDHLKPLVAHLRESGQLNAGLILRALLCGNVSMFENALTELSGLAPARVAGLVHDRCGTGFRALYDRAGLPESAYPAFRAARETMVEVGFAAEPGGATRLRRRMVERVLTACEAACESDIEPLLMLLRRFATEAARDEARVFCDELVAA
jgi:uncharacterized protein (DUF2336 family)